MIFIYFLGALYILYPGLYVAGALFFLFTLCLLRRDIRRLQEQQHEINSLKSEWSFSAASCPTYEKKYCKYCAFVGLLLKSIGGSAINCSWMKNGPDIMESKLVDNDIGLCWFDRDLYIYMWGKSVIVVWRRKELLVKMKSIEKYKMSTILMAWCYVEKFNRSYVLRNYEEE